MNIEKILSDLGINATLKYSESDYYYYLIPEKEPDYFGWYINRLQNGKWRIGYGNSVVTSDDYWACGLGESLEEAVRYLREDMNKNIAIVTRQLGL